MVVALTPSGFEKAARQFRYIDAMKMLLTDDPVDAAAHGKSLSEEDARRLDDAYRSGEF
jgi:hypothetical protein